jgi:hypothetical protein
MASPNDAQAETLVRNSMTHLQDIILKTKKNIFELSVSPDLSYKNVLLLSYYR